MRSWLALFVGFTICVAAGAAALSPAEALYRTGVLPDGRALRGERPAGQHVDGLAAACATCHRRSGLGSAEGRITVPPITGEYLGKPRVTDLRAFGESALGNRLATREPYTAATLARAVREGVDPSGRQLSELMPRYALDDATIATLSAYLHDLSQPATPGVTEDTLHFATIITPDADPTERDGMLAVMRKFFDDRNSFIRGGSRRMQTSRQIEYRVARRWQLHVWELTGPSSGWEAQLAAKLAAEPVFAVVSGLGGRDWSPVHRFCEAQRLPCLFPNVSLPVVAEDDFYPMYFSRGVHLDADLVLSALAGRDARPGRVIQLVRGADIGAVPAAELDAALVAQGARVVTRTLGGVGGGTRELNSALADVTAADTLVLWLRAADLAALPAAAPAAGAVYVSGSMGGMEAAPIPAAWRTATHIAYPADLPDARRARMSYALGWFMVSKIPLVAQRVQTDTYIACGILAETLSEMLENFVREHLVERIESMLSHRLVTGYYPRLSLAPGQRFASKGGYLVHFTGPQGTAIAADSDWQIAERPVGAPAASR
jgi:hypothetical protein